MHICVDELTITTKQALMVAIANRHLGNLMIFSLAMTAGKRLQGDEGILACVALHDKSVGNAILLPTA